MARFLAGGPPRVPDHALVVEAFRWSAPRTVTKTATVSLAGNRYQVDPSLVGQKIELRYDPEDLSSLSVYAEGRLICMATPFVIGRHVHPAVPHAQTALPASPPAVDYLNWSCRRTTTRSSATLRAEVPQGGAHRPDRRPPRRRGCRTA